MLMSSTAPLSHLENQSEFIARHIGISEADEKHMLSVIGVASRRALIDSIVPASIGRSTWRDLAQHFGKPRLVYRLHTLSS